MSYNLDTNIWEGIWETWHGPDGGYKICVKAQGYQTGASGQFSAEALRNVYVNNPPIHVTSWVWNGDKYECMDGLEVYCWQQGKEIKLITPFDFERSRDSKLNAPKEWDTGDGRVVQFQRWVISAGDPNVGITWEHGETGIGIDDSTLETLWKRTTMPLHAKTVISSSSK